MYGWRTGTYTYTKEQGRVWPRQRPRGLCGLLCG
jgi:hypothetical protein